MRKVRTWLAVGGVAAMLLWLLTESLTVNLQAGRSVPLFSVYRYDPLGMAALRQYLQASGVRVRLLKHPVLDTEWNGVLINIQPPSAGGHMLLSATLTKHYHPRLMRWIKRGNTLFEVTYHNTRLTGHERLTVKPLPKRSKKRRTRRSAPERTVGMSLHRAATAPATAPSSTGKGSPKPAKLTGKKHRTKIATAGKKHHRFLWRHSYASLARVDKFYNTHRNPSWYAPTLIPAHWHPRHEAHRVTGGKLQAATSLVWLAMPSRFIGWNAGKRPVWHPLLTYKHHALAIERRYGKGRIVLLGSPWPLLNGGIDTGKNIDFVMSVIGSKSVILNEWGLGIGGQMTTLELFSKFGLVALGIQLLVLLAAILWDARRFPHRRALSSRPVVASNVEQIAMLGRLYQQSMPSAEVHSRVADEVHRRLAACLRVQPDGIAPAANRLRADLQIKIKQLLADVQRLARPAGNENGHQKEQYRHCADLLSRSSILCEELKRERKS